MKLCVYPIGFDYRVDNVSVGLRAEIQFDGYASLIARNFRTADSDRCCRLPEMALTRIGHLWVHCESLKESVLSQAIGHAIETQLPYVFANYLIIS